VNVTGVDLLYEAPEVRLDTSASSPDEAVERLLHLLRLLRERGVILQSRSQGKRRPATRSAPEVTPAGRSPERGGALPTTDDRPGPRPPSTG
jgi:hypothetical protein